jgi:RND superfamily putative drug exporter
LVVVVCALGSSAVFDRVKPFGFQDPDSESSRASHRLEEATGERVLPDIVLLVERSKLADGAAAIGQAARELRAVPGVTRVLTPADDPLLRTEDGREGLIVGFVDADVDDVPEVGETVEDEFSGQRGITVGGASVTSHQLNETTEDDLQRIELFAAPLILLLSLLVFRGFVAALLPLAVGVLSILSTLLLLGALTVIVDIDAFAINIVTGLGLGLAIDYSLFLVSRFREELAESPTEAALAATMQTTGRMIVFSGLTVAVALISLCIFPQRFLYSIGLGGAMVALSSAAVCLLVLPALLAMLGPRVNALAPRWLQARPPERRWSGLAHWVLRYPISIAIVTVAVMIFAGLPFLRVELTRADASVLPQDSSARRVDEAIRKRFSADPASRIVIVTRPGPEGEVREGAVRKLTRQPTVEEVEQPVSVSAGVTRIDAQLRGDPFADKAVDAVDLARSLHWGGKALVGGPSAELSDQRASLGDHLPIALAFIVVSTSLILFVMTGSVVLPAVALAMNALTVSVAFGALVFIFQDGRLEDVLGFTSQNALDTSMPILLFAVAFGLSTDYGVFLLQRIDEARAENHGPEAIATGLTRGGRQITAAALLFAVAMGVFAFSELIYVKEVAVGTAIAVLVDATIVRAFLFPAVLFLLGPWAWWSPRWLERRAAGLR